MSLRRSVPRPAAWDSLLAVATLLVEAFAAARRWPGAMPGLGALAALPVLAWIVLLAGSAALVLRRHRPLIVLSVVVVAYVVWHLLGYTDGPSLAIFVALYGLGRYIAGPRTTMFALVAATGAFIATAIGDGDPMADLAVAAIVVPLLPWYIGRRVAARQERLRLLGIGRSCSNANRRPSFARSSTRNGGASPASCTMSWHTG